MGESVLERLLRFEQENESLRNTCIELSKRLMAQMDRADKAECEAQELKIELMDRDQRIWVLEQKLGIPEAVLKNIGF